jgi:shikimate dehydrogenase
VVSFVAEPDHDALLAQLPPRSLVINATGMGKDIPGSPIGDGAWFPERAIAWELNYRGDLRFLRQARAQESERELLVADGWRYFIYGWTSVIEEVFERPISADDLELLASEAEFARPEREE